jgi:hypothetical protein
MNKEELQPGLSGAISLLPQFLCVARRKKYETSQAKQQTMLSRKE